MTNILGIRFYGKDIKDLVQELSREINLDKKVSVFTPNVDHIINNKENLQVEEIYGQSEYIIADGWPLVAYSKFCKNSIFRITGVDLVDELLQLANQKSYNVFFLGSEDSTLEKLKVNINKKYGNIPLIETHNGYFQNNTEVIEKINKNKYHFVFVGMGNPKQEIWIRENMDKLNVNILIGVGGAFKIYSEEVSRAPKWIQYIGMEWFYRFCKEPKRLFQRYFIKYPRFLKIMFNDLMKNRSIKRES